MTKLKLYENFTSDEVKDKAINELARIILVNHEADEKELKKGLSEMYDYGHEIGTLSGKLGVLDFGGVYLKKYKPSDRSKMIKSIVEKLDPKRILNHRNFVYDAKDIKSSSVLANDYTIQQSINMMKNKNSDYMYFERERFDKKKFDLRMEKEELYDGEKEGIVEEYNQLEVGIFMSKAYQLGFSEGELNTSKISEDIREIFRLESHINAFRNGEKSPIKSNDEASEDEEFLDRLKKKNPDWEQYGNLFA